MQLRRGRAPPWDRPSISQRLESRVTTSTSPDAGSRRRARRAQKLESETVPVLANSRSRREVIRNPDSTKNTSTPMKPPETTPNLAWYTSTSNTAIERRPSISGRKSAPASATPSARGGTSTEAPRAPRDIGSSPASWRDQSAFFTNQTANNAANAMPTTTDSTVADVTAIVPSLTRPPPYRVGAR